MPYTPDQLLAAAKKADASGDGEAARKLLVEYKAATQQAPQQRQLTVKSDPLDPNSPDVPATQFETTGKASGKEYKIKFLAPAGADDSTIQAMSLSALRDAYPSVEFSRQVNVHHPDQPVERPTWAEAGWQAARDLGTNLSAGAAAIPDLLSQGGRAIQDIAGEAANFLATGGGASSGTVGNPSGADRQGAMLRSAINAPQMAGPQTIGEYSNALNPQAQNAPGAFAQQMVGSAIVPIPGPKAAPKAGYNALALAEQASARAAPVVENALAAPTAKEVGRQVVDTGKREGVRVMTSDVRPPKTFLGKAARATAEKIPVVGTGGLLGPGGRAAQEAERIAAIKNLVAEHGSESSDELVNAISGDLAKTRGAQLTKLSAAKDSVISGIPGAVPAPNATKALAEQVVRLEGINAEAFAPVISKLKQFGEALNSGKTLSQIEGNRKLLGDLFADPNLAAIKGDGQKALNAIYGPLREDMAAFIKANGKPGDLARWKGANERLAAMAGELKDAGFKRVLQKAETSPEDVAKLLFSKKPSEVRRLFSNLSPAGLVKGRAALIHKAAEGATDAAGNISPQKFATGLGALEKATGAFFAPVEKARIDGLQRLLVATSRASEASVMTNSGQQAVPYLLGGAGAAHPYLLGTLGLLGRAYESGPVRDLLLRLGRANAGSKQEGAMLEAIMTTLQRLAPRLAAPAATNAPANDVGSILSRSPGSAAAGQDVTDTRREPPAQ